MNPNLGSLITEQAEKDAIHIAVAPATAAVQLFPSQRVAMREDGSFEPATGDRALGIVDPFLSHPVPAGDRFWFVLFPGTVTGMRHEWQHPQFQRRQDSIVPTDPKSVARANLERAADLCDMSYKGFIERLSEFCESGEAFHMGTNESYKEIIFDEKFWADFELVTGFKPKEGSWPEMPFSCSC